MSAGDREGNSFIYSALHVGGDGGVMCHAYADDSPILTISAGPGSLTVCVRDGRVTGATVRFARALTRGAEKFAAEVERLHAGQDAGSGKAA